MLFKLYSYDCTYFLVHNYRYIRVVDPTRLGTSIKYLTLEKSYVSQTLTKVPKDYGWCFIKDITPQSHPEVFI